MPPTGQRQAIEVHIKWREVLDFKRELLRMLSIGTGWSVEKLDAVRGPCRGRGGGRGELVGDGGWASSTTKSAEVAGACSEESSSAKA